MREYLDLLARIMADGEDVATGTRLESDGSQPLARFLLSERLEFNLADGFPGVTTKRLYFESVVKEILWFLRGETNVKTLGCRIWDQWSARELDDPLRPATETRPPGECGPIYGAQFRHWEYPDEMGDVATFDQIVQIVRDLRAVRDQPTHRARRRIILTGWNPPDVPLMGLPPCHTLAQFLPSNGTLHCVCHWRSIDCLTGLPFNLAQYGLLTELFARLTGFRVGRLVANIADAHIYHHQFEAVQEQLTRTPRTRPTLRVSDEVLRLAPDLTIEQCRCLHPDMFGLDDYSFDVRPIRAELAV